MLAGNADDDDGAPARIFSLALLSSSARMLLIYFPSALRCMSPLHPLLFTLLHMHISRGHLTTFSRLPMPWDTKRKKGIVPTRFGQQLAPRDVCFLAASPALKRRQNLGIYYVNQTLARVYSFPSPATPVYFSAFFEFVVFKPYLTFVTCSWMFEENIKAIFHMFNEFRHWGISFSISISSNDACECTAFTVLLVFMWFL